MKNTFVIGLIDKIDEGETIVTSHVAVIVKSRKDELNYVFTHLLQPKRDCEQEFQNQRINKYRDKKKFIHRILRKGL